MNILFRAYFGQQNFVKKILRKFIRSGSGAGRFRKSDPDPVKNHPYPQHCIHFRKESLHEKEQITTCNLITSCFLITSCYQKKTNGRFPTTGPQLTVTAIHRW
jgi:hypothetical protein